MSEITPELEAVARAICIENLKATNQPKDDGTVEHYWPHFVKEARAALSAIREPTARMTIAGHARLHDKGCACKDCVALSFTAAIDSILSDTRTPTEGDLL